MTLAEELEQTGQDAARFRWLAQELIGYDALGYVLDKDPADINAVRRLIDAKRDTTVAPPGALYVPEFTPEQIAYGCKVAVDTFLAFDPAEVMDIGSPLFDRLKHGP